ncbi:MAG: methyltransferase [Nocardioides sp.]
MTAIDVSPTALARTAAAAATFGVASRVTTERHDLASSFPAGRFDLVVAMFFQSPLELAREEVLRRSAESLDPGGHLVVVEHGSGPAWSEDPPEGAEHHHLAFATPEELVALIDLDPARFAPVTVESRSRAVTHEGRSGTVLDTVVVVRRVG